eukprot:scaffold170010_cov15-Prasinocladus_malaysianus.AAC.1
MVTSPGKAKNMRLVVLMCLDWQCASTQCGQCLLVQDLSSPRHVSCHLTGLPNAQPCKCMSASGRGITDSFIIKSLIQNIQSKENLTSQHNKAILDPKQPNRLQEHAGEICQAVFVPLLDNKVLDSYKRPLAAATTPDELKCIALCFEPNEKKAKSGSKESPGRLPDWSQKTDTLAAGFVLEKNNSVEGGQGQKNGNSLDNSDFRRVPAPLEGPGSCCLHNKANAKKYYWPGGLSF